MNEEISPQRNAGSVYGSLKHWERNSGHKCVPEGRCVVQCGSCSWLMVSQLH